MEIQEKVFFEKNGVLITKTRAVFSDKTYVLGNVSSIKTDHTSVSHGWGNLPWYLMGLGLFLFIMAGPSASGSAVVGLLGVIAGVLGIWLAGKRPQVIDTYHLSLVTNSGESRVYSSSDENLITQIKDAISLAVAEVSEVKVSGSASTSESKGAGSVEDRMMSLKVMLDNGLISQAEFDAKKGDLLSRL